MGGRGGLTRRHKEGRWQSCRERSSGRSRRAGCAWASHLGLSATAVVCGYRLAVASIRTPMLKILPADQWSLVSRPDRDDRPASHRVDLGGRRIIKKKTTRV